MTGAGADNFSFGRLVARALGAAAAVLLLAVPLVWWLATTHEVAALVVAIVAVVLMIAVMALIARRELRDVQGEIDRIKLQNQQKHQNQKEQ